jgi:ferrous iron transport protein B
MVFILLAAPCFAAIGAIRREMGSWKWTGIALGYQTGVAYVLAAIVNQVGSLLFPYAEPIQLTGSLEEASEGAITSASILQNPMIYVLGAVLLAVLVIGVFSRFKKMSPARSQA